MTFNCADSLEPDIRRGEMSAVDTVAFDAVVENQIDHRPYDGEYY